MRKLLLFLILFFITACESQGISNPNVNNNGEVQTNENNRQEDINSSIVDEVDTTSSDIENSYDFQLGVLSDVDIDFSMLSHISNDMIIFNQAEPFDKLNYKFILIIYTNQSSIDISKYRQTPSEEGLLFYSKFQDQDIYTLNIGVEDNLQNYISQIPSDLFTTARSIKLSILDKNYIESDNKNLRLYDSKLFDDSSSVGVLTGALNAGTKLSFFPTVKHTTYNDKNDLYEGDHEVLVILQESDFDMGVSAQAYGINLKKGEVASKQVAENLRVIFVRPSSNERLEIFNLTEEIFQLDGHGSFDDFMKLVLRQREESNSIIDEVQNEMDIDVSVEITDLSTLRKNADFCRLEQGPRRSHSEVYGFPIQTMIPHKGRIDVAVIPVDFTEYPGDPELILKLRDDLPKMTEWSDFYSGGKMVYQVHTTNEWIRAPKGAEYYRSRDGEISEGYQGQDRRILPLLQPQEASVSQLIAASDNLIDWSIIDVVIFIFPVDSIEEQTHLYMHMGTFQSPSKGTVRFPVWGENFHELSQSNPDLTYWDWSVHEILHWQGLVGHGPLNHSDYSIMTNQYSSSAGLHAWEAFLLDWWDENDFTCINPKDISAPITFKFDSIDQLGSNPGNKSLMLPLNNDEIIVMEYRTKGEWSSLETVFEGIVIYYVNVDGDFVRCDSCNQLEIEQQNFWRILRNDRIMPCQAQFVPHCGYPSIVQKPGYELIYEDLKFEILTRNIVQITNLNN